jgi:signal-transduction protein with cAMP-binding, CBS, and nucleotidyltransferase domain
VNHLYVISKGSAELYFEQDQKKILRRLLSEGDCFGGIAMLVNESLAVRSMTLVENTTFLCQRESPKTGILQDASLTITSCGGQNDCTSKGNQIR